MAFVVCRKQESCSEIFFVLLPHFGHKQALSQPHIRALFLIIHPFYIVLTFLREVDQLPHYLSLIEKGRQSVHSVTNQDFPELP